MAVMRTKAGATKTVVTSVVAAGEATPLEGGVESRGVEARRKRDSGEEVFLETMFAASVAGQRAGYQDEIRAHLQAELEAEATLVDCLDDGKPA